MIVPDGEAGDRQVSRTVSPAPSRLSAQRARRRRTSSRRRCGGRRATRRRRRGRGVTAPETCTPGAVGRWRGLRHALGGHEPAEQRHALGDRLGGRARVAALARRPGGRSRGPGGSRGPSATRCRGWPRRGPGRSPRRGARPTVPRSPAAMLACAPAWAGAWAGADAVSATAAAGGSRRGDGERGHAQAQSQESDKGGGRLWGDGGRDPPRQLSSEKAQRIVDAMRGTCVGTRGATGATFDHVAREAGVSRGLLHYYFGTKERLLVEVVRRDCDLRMERMTATTASAGSARTSCSARSARAAARDDGRGDRVPRDPARAAHARAGRKRRSRPSWPS